MERVCLRVFLMVALAVLVACQSSRDTNTLNLTPQSNSGYIKDVLSSPPRDLTQDEAAGGHVLRKHVGRTDDELRERLDQERHISGASTYTDRSTAEHAVGAAIAISHDRIQRWLNRSGGHSNLVLDYDSGRPLGRTLNRGDSQPRLCSHAVVVLRYAAPSYYVLTSYPECRS